MAMYKLQNIHEEDIQNLYRIQSIHVQSYYRQSTSPYLFYLGQTSRTQYRQ